MGFERLQRFVQYLQQNNLLTPENVRQAIQQMGGLDKQIARLGGLFGFIPPEHINAILLEQTQTGGTFGECAIRLKLLMPTHIDQLFQMQKDELYLFAQSIVMQRIMARGKINDHIRAFLDVDSQASSASEAPSDPSEIRRRLDEGVEGVLGHIKEMSALPNVAQRVLSMLDDPAVNLDQVADIVCLDPATSAMILRVVNSAYYGLMSEVKNIKQGLVILGIDKLRSLIIAVGALEKFRNIPKEFVMPFWAHTLRAAEWSRQIGKALDMKDADDLFMGGLLHNIGELVIRQFFRRQQERIDEMVAVGYTFLVAEKEILGATHADIGGFLFNFWRLPKAHIQSGILHHHNIHFLVATPKVCVEAFVVHMAVAISDMERDSGTGKKHIGNLEDIRKQYTGPLDFPRSLQMADLAENMAVDLKRVRAILGKDLFGQKDPGKS